MPRSISYLGLVFHSVENGKKNQPTLADKANKRIFQMHKILNQFKTLRVYLVLDLFDKLIIPVLCYGCKVWAFHSASAIERMHLSFFKACLGRQEIILFMVHWECIRCEL